MSGNQRLSLQDTFIFAKGLAPSKRKCDGVMFSATVQAGRKLYRQQGDERSHLHKILEVSFCSIFVIRKQWTEGRRGGRRKDRRENCGCDKKMKLKNK